MFVLSYKDNALFRGIATLVTIALVMWGLGMHVHNAQAANITDAYDLLSTSATSTPSNHTIEFVTPSGVADGETIVLDFDPDTSAFDLTGIGDEDIDILEDDTNVPLAGWSSALNGDELTITFGGDSIAAGATTTILIGDHATNEGSPDTQIVNPATQGSYEINVTAGSQDSGHLQVAIVDSVYVTASVNTSFDFTVSGFSSAGTAVNGTSTTGTSTATSLPFGTLTAGEIETLAQTLNVTTNAINGYVVTVETNQQLLSSTGADIDGFADGAFDDTPAVWTSPSNTISDEDTWGHWGLTSSDSDLQGNDTDFGADNTWISASTSPRTIMAHNGPSDGSTGSNSISGGDDVGSTTVGYQVEITALQEAGDDYNAILTYIATPTF